jgi:NitT/TauT family transport system ATP-binding protein
MFITHDVEEAVYLADRVIVLSTRPGEIKRELEIDLPRPRRQRMIAEPEFGRLVRELLTELGVDI